MKIGMEHIKSLRTLYEIEQRMCRLIEEQIRVPYKSTKEHIVVRDNMSSRILLDIRVGILPILNSYYWALKQVKSYNVFSLLCHGVSHMVFHMDKRLQKNKDAIVKTYPKLEELYTLIDELKEITLDWAINISEVYESR